MSDVHSPLAGSDDYGWSDAGWHNPTDDLRTPTLNALVATGIEFDRHYVFKCESVLYRGMATRQGAFSQRAGVLRQIALRLGQRSSLGVHRTMSTR